MFFGGAATANHNILDATSKRLKDQYQMEVITNRRIRRIATAVGFIMVIYILLRVYEVL
ncbi:hypothetical protein GGR28_002903 [Lewinella aquimaris]|uniref:Uncharacterized protein n=1 Tax=Neolewinella aquimaris TaxID=1835722 RepID=A0A840E8L0_9BACT|nr:hypothetical protein [Neolewinella aquimaris]